MEAAERAVSHVAMSRMESGKASHAGMLEGLVI